MTKIVPNHVAVLVPSVRKAAEHLKQFDFTIGKEEEWDGEGTREIYVERELGNRLLLMEPAKAGAYQRALDKRGPGVHHLAIDVLNLHDFIESVPGSGWLLHPKSLKTIKDSKTAYLARPGFPALIEVQEREQLFEDSLFVTEILLPVPQELVRMIKPIGLEGIVTPFSGETQFKVSGATVRLSDLI